MAIVASIPAATWESSSRRGIVAGRDGVATESAQVLIRIVNAIALLTMCTAIVGQIEPVRS